jgi:hypothetical protein
MAVFEHDANKPVRFLKPGSTLCGQRIQPVWGNRRGEDSRLAGEPLAARGAEPAYFLNGGLESMKRAGDVKLRLDASYAKQRRGPDLRI